jgi:hypothetical protein
MIAPLAIAALFACEPDAPPVPQGTDTPAPPAHALPTGSVTDTLPVPVGEDAVVARTPRRMHVDQLKASMEQVSGGIVWIEDGDVMFDTLAATLGKPDWITATTEDKTPGLLFQKFLDDAATYTCEQMLERESADPLDPALLVEATLADTWDSNPLAIEANLSAALLRWHGRQVPVGDPQLEPWTFLFASTLLVSDGDTWAGWRAVCVGLFTHPDFYTY